FRKSPQAQNLNLNAFGNNGTLFELMGGPLAATGLAGAFYLGGLAADSPKAKATAGLIIQAFALNSFFVLTLKEAVGRTRPISSNSLDPNQFKPFSGQASFPSGHTSTAFAAASVIAEQYPSWWVAGASYATAGLVGGGRVLQDRHWTSDVAAGAILGYSSGKIAARHNKTEWSMGLDLETPGITLAYRF
ncbi:MAG: phosphatase PAP2 family protein, partial [Elusimicrobiota bacterium]